MKPLSSVHQQNVNQGYFLVKVARKWMCFLLFLSSQLPPGWRSLKVVEDGEARCWKELDLESPHEGSFLPIALGCYLGDIDFFVFSYWKIWGLLQLTNPLTCLWMSEIATEGKSSSRWEAIKFSCINTWWVIKVKANWLPKCASVHLMRNSGMLPQS